MIAPIVRQSVEDVAGDEVAEDVARDKVAENMAGEEIKDFAGVMIEQTTTLIHVTTVVLVIYITLIAAQQVTHMTVTAPIEMSQSAIQVEDVAGDEVTEDVTGDEVTEDVAGDKVTEDMAGDEVADTITLMMVMIIPVEVE